MRKIISGMLLVLFLSACSMFPIPGEAATATPVEPVPTLEPSSTPVVVTLIVTNTPTSTLEVTETPAATETVTPTATEVGADKIYQVQPSSPVYLQNFAHQNLGCNWMGVAGQVFDASDTPVKNLVVVVEGFLNDQAVNQLGLTGLAPAYGPGGYEIQLASSAIASSQSLFVTLYDVNGTALTVPVVFDTVADCNKNLVLINFQRK